MCNGSRWVCEAHPDRLWGVEVAAHTGRGRGTRAGGGWKNVPRMGGVELSAKRAHPWSLTPILQFAVLAWRR